MSTIETCVVTADNADQMRKSGKSLAETLYSNSTTIVIFGDLGAGKTTLVQGFGAGLGIHDQITSPSFPLEQRYDEKLSHIDLYRLSPEQAEDFLRQTEEFPGIRVIEWPERTSSLRSDIQVTIEERGESIRDVTVQFADVRIPSHKEIDAFKVETKIPQHIVDHMNAVAKLSERLGKHLIAQGVFVRLRALIAAAELHDILRFVDFESWNGNDLYVPTTNDRETWKVLKERYGSHHEEAAERFLMERGFSEIGSIVRTHRGCAKEGSPPMKLTTTEQKILAYADKRIRFTEEVSLDERFDDFIQRYGKGQESQHARHWRAAMKKLESSLFGSLVPF